MKMGRNRAGARTLRWLGLCSSSFILFPLAGSPTVSPTTAGPLWAGAFVGAASLAAQEPDTRERSSGNIRITGEVVDVSSGQAVPSAEIRFTPSAGDTSPYRAISAGNGRFRFEDVPPGDYTLTVSALGFRDLSEGVVVGTMSPVDVRIEIVPEALELEPIIVTATARGYLHQTGFYDRQRTGIGTFFTREEFLRRAGFRVSDVFRSIPGARVVETGFGSVAQVTFRGGCRPDLYVDGVRTVPGTSVDEILAVHDVEAMEVYRGAASIPAQYSRGGCAAIVIWTREPGGGDRPFSWRRLGVAAGFVLGALFLTR